jgi:3-methyladenine DNA glycosylase AlkD
MSVARGSKTTALPVTLTAAVFTQKLLAHRSAAQAKGYEGYFKLGEGEYGAGDTFAGVKMGQVFALAKAFIDLPPAEIEKLLDSSIHEVRAGALSIMDKQARRKQTPAGRRKELFDLYFRRIERINNWDLVDLAAPFVVGGYLFDKPRKKLYTLARSKNLWQRRTAIVSTLYFLRQGQADDSFKLAALLLKDKEDLIHKAASGALRFAGDLDRPALLSFLDQHAASMPRTMLRYALEHLDQKQRAYYLGLKTAG